MDSTPANLEFFRSDTMERINLADLGTAYKNSDNGVIGLVIANTGGRKAINVKAKFINATRSDGRTDSVSKDWKLIAYDADAIYKPMLDLPDIPVGSLMPGYKVKKEEFDFIIGKDLPQDWITSGEWEVYLLTEDNGRRNQYLHHIVQRTNANTGKAIPMHFDETYNSDTNVDIAVQRGNFGGIQLRMDSLGYGYFIIVYPEPAVIEKINDNYKTIIPNYVPIEPTEAVIGIGKGYFTDLDFDINDVFKIYKKCTYWFPVGTGSIGLSRDTLRVSLTDDVVNVWFGDKYIGRYVDPYPIVNKGRLSLIAGNKYGSVVIFDNLEYKVQTERGILYVKSVVPPNPEPSLDPDNIYYSTLLIEYSD